MKPISYACLAILTASGCAEVIDTRQTVSEPTFGVAFTGEVLAINSVRGGYSTSGQSAFIGESLTRHSIEKRNPDGGGFGNYADALAGIAGGLVTETEQIIRSTRCMYFVTISDEKISGTISDQILFGLDDDEGGTFVFVDDDLLGQNYSGNSSIDNTSATTETNASGGVRNRVLALPQACDPQILVGGKVIMTYSDNGSTIHPITDKMFDLNAALNAYKYDPLDSKEIKAE
jgi:hypothetical protein